MNYKRVIYKRLRSLFSRFTSKAAFSLSFFPQTYKPVQTLVLPGFTRLFSFTAIKNVHSSFLWNDILLDIAVAPHESNSSLVSLQQTNSHSDRSVAIIWLLCMLCSNQTCSVNVQIYQKADDVCICEWFSLPVHAWRHKNSCWSASACFFSRCVQVERWVWSLCAAGAREHLVNENTGSHVAWRLILPLKLQDAA